MSAASDAEPSGDVTGPGTGSATGSAPGRPSEPGTAPPDGAPVEHPRRRKRRGRLGLLLLVVLFLAVAGEIALRVHERGLAEQVFVSAEMAEYLAASPYVTVDDDELPYRNAPGLRTTAGGVVYAHDAHGWRITPGGADGGAEGGAEGGADGGAGRGAAVTVAFLGDSMTYGWGVDAEHALPQLVSDALDGRVAALNLGVSAHGTTEAARLYERDREALAARGTTAVVLIVFPNDFNAASFAWHADTGFLAVDPLPLPAWWRNRLSRLALYRGLASWRSGVERLAGRYDATDPAGADTVLEPLSRLAAAVAADGRRLLVAYLPAVADLVATDHDWQSPALAARCAELGVPFTDLRGGYLDAWNEVKTERPQLVADRPEADALRGWALRHWVLSLQDQHLDAEGNRVIAAALAPAVAALLED